MLELVTIELQQRIEYKLELKLGNSVISGARPKIDSSMIYIICECVPHSTEYTYKDIFMSGVLHKLDGDNFRGQKQA